MTLGVLSLSLDLNGVHIRGGKRWHPVPMHSEARFPRARGSETSQGSGDPPSSQQKLLLFSTTD